MKNMLSRFGGKTAAVMASIAAVMVAGAGLSGAVGEDPVSDGFTTLTTNLTGYVAAGVTLCVTLLLIGAGMRVLVRWARRAASSS